MSIKDGIVGAMVVGGGSSGGGGTPVVPNINATAESLPAGSEATVEKSGTNTNITLNFGIPRGADGQQGAPGATGPAGPQGAQGQQGPAGPTGQQGPRGEQGPTGAQGPEGPQGPQGIQGEKGDQGTPFLISKLYDTYEEMNAGYSSDGLLEGQLAAIKTETGGEYGGYIYVKGPTQYDFFYDISTTDGIQGPQGPQGEQGPQGPAGPAGATGATGPAGAQGAQGPKGDKGDTGEQGPQGPAGQAATIQVGTVTTGEPGTNASVTNSGTSSAAVFDFVIPRGQDGSGGGGAAGVSSFNGRTGAVVPQNGDYTAAQVGARPDNWMPAAGDGVNVAGETMSVRVSQAADNATGILNGALYTSIPRPSAVYPLVEVTTVPATASIQVTATKGELSVQGTTDENGKVDIELSAFGVWTFTATIDGEQATADVAVNASQLYTLTLSPYSVFGVAWDKTNPSTQLTRLTPESDPNGLVTVAITEEPVPAVGTGAGSSPFDQYAPWNGMYVCNLSADGTETAKQGDGRFSYSTADVMVHIPEFYYRVIDTENIRYFYIADGQADGFEVHPGSNSYVSKFVAGPGYQSVSGVAPLTNITRDQARVSIAEKGENWFQYDFTSYCAIIWLYLIEFSDWNSQLEIGSGVVTGSTFVNNGATDSMTYHTGSVVGTDGRISVRYRNFENLWGNVWQYVDGVNTNVRTIYLCTDPENFADNTDANYISTNVTVDYGSPIWIRTLGYSENFPWGILPMNGGGSSTTYIPDGIASGFSGWYALCVGGDNAQSNIGIVGLFYFNNGISSSDAYPNIAPRLVYRSKEVTA